MTTVQRKLSTICKHGQLKIEPQNIKLRFAELKVTIHALFTKLLCLGVLLRKAISEPPTIINLVLAII